MKTMAKRSKQLHEEMLLFQILPWLPARSLGRFKCVCKQWRSFLTTPMFTKMHLHHVNNQNHHKQLVFSTTKPCKYFRTIDCETPEVGLSANRSLPFKANCEEMSIIASLNGLVCIGIDPLHTCRYSDIILWNPLTGGYKTLSKDNSRFNCFTIPARGYGLYYSSCEDDYRLLRVTLLNEAFIYSFKYDSWRKVESTNYRLSKYLDSSCLLNENLYLLAQSNTKTSLRSYSILRFNTNTEKFTEIAAPSLQRDVWCCFSLTVVSGCVYLCASTKGVYKGGKLDFCDGSGKFDLWKMDGDEEWTKVASICEFYQPFHLMMKNGNRLVVWGGSGNAYEVDLGMKTTKKVSTYTPTPTDGPMCFLWRGKFVETIVSPNK
ncbi:hypothetical protein OSB04_028561 [Centaurea solstitialis]|uniref:F-box domain-containing protein n=1 Tax=Centaurea solstitialis TaxID=347529 RepID=A0AA38SG00_9ASTR|nr:hypothetical protein OSB04_028561 [Centaurea solstitialis]